MTFIVLVALCILGCFTSVSTLTAEETAICLGAHNKLRAIHDTAALVWDEDLASAAQAWADHLAETNTFEHDSDDNGENIYMEDNSEVFSCANAVLDWYNEISAWDFTTSASKGGVTGHFTQVVWKGTTKVGVGIAQVPSPKFAMYGNKLTIVVAKYSPPGNFGGEYAENVLPLVDGAVTPSKSELAETDSDLYDEDIGDEEPTEEDEEATEDGSDESEDNSSDEEADKDDSSENKKDKKKDKKKNKKKDKKNKKNKKSGK